MCFNVLKKVCVTCVKKKKKFFFARVVEFMSVREVKSGKQKPQKKKGGKKGKGGQRKKAQGAKSEKLNLSIFLGTWTLPEEIFPFSHKDPKVVSDRILINDKTYKLALQYNEYISKIGTHNFYINLENQLILKQSLLNRELEPQTFDSRGLDIYTLNEICVLRYLQSFPQYYTENWFHRFTELKDVSFCTNFSGENTPQNRNICLLYTRYNEPIENWRKKFKSDELVPILPIAQFIHSLLENLIILEQCGIVHRGITTTNCFVGKNWSIVLGGWGNSTLERNHAWIDNLLFTSIVSNNEEINALVDRVMVANVIYYIVYGKNPIHIENMKAKTQNLVPTEVKQMMLKEEVKDPYLFSNSNSYFDLIIQRLIKELLDKKVEVKVTLKNFADNIQKTEEYYFYQQASESKKILIPQIITNVLQTFSKTEDIKKKVKLSLNEKECNQFFGTNPEEKKTVQDKLISEYIPSVFFKIFKVVQNTVKDIPNSMLCFVNQLYYRSFIHISKNNVRGQVSLPKIETKTTPLSFEFVYQCALFYMAFKIYGFMYLPSHIESFKTILMTLFNVKEDINIKTIFLLLHNFETAICTATNFTFLTFQSQEFFENPSICAEEKKELKSQILNSLAQYLNDNYAYVVFDMFLFVKNKLYTEQDIETSVSEQDTNLKNFFQLLSKKNLFYFISRCSFYFCERTRSSGCIHVIFFAFYSNKIQLVELFLVTSY